MFARYRAGLALTSLVLLLGAHHRVPQTPALRPVSAGELYSRRALRRARIILQLKLLELRSERLERVRKAIERGIPIEELLKDA